MSPQVTHIVVAAVWGLLFGFICGLVPLGLALGRGRPRLGAVSLLICAAAGAAAGLLLAVPLTAFLTWQVLRLPRAVSAMRTATGTQDSSPASGSNRSIFG